MDVASISSHRYGGITQGNDVINMSTCEQNKRHKKSRIFRNWVLSCLAGILANTPAGVKWSGLGAHAVGLLVVY